MLQFSIKAHAVGIKGQFEKKNEEMNGRKDVKLSTLKSNGIFLFNYTWLNLWDVDVCVEMRVRANVQEVVTSLP